MENRHPIVEVKVPNLRYLLPSFDSFLSHPYPLIMVHHYCTRRSLSGNLPRLNLAWPSHLSWQVQSMFFRVKFIFYPTGIVLSSLQPGRSLTNLVEVNCPCERFKSKSISRCLVSEADPDFQRAKLCGESRGYLVVIFWW